MRSDRNQAADGRAPSGKRPADEREHGGQTASRGGARRLSAGLATTLLTCFVCIVLFFVATQAGRQAAAGSDRSGGATPAAVSINADSAALKGLEGLEGLEGKDGTRRRDVDPGSPLVTWCTEQGLFDGFAIASDGSMFGIYLRLRVSPECALPEHGFRTQGLRFDPQGNLIEILPPPSSSAAAFCVLHVLFLDDDPRRAFLVCEGACAEPDECLMLIDLATLTVACGCEET